MVPLTVPGAGIAFGGSHRVRLRLHYDGTDFAGWQVQTARRTVQGDLESALERLTAAPARVIAAGRTDTGVHATGQVVGVTVPAKWTPAELQRALNAVLPADMWVAEAVSAAPGFHARYDAVARGYLYRVGTTAVSRSPFLRRWCWSPNEPYDLDTPDRLEALNDAAGRLVGDNSYRAFAKSGQPQRGERCIVHRAEWRKWPGVGVTFHVVANRFLHHMVRYLVGTQVEVGLGRRRPSEIERLLAGGTGLRTSRPAPARGLFLTRVYYQGDQIAEDMVDEIFPGQR
ncbi:MAG: tRNA pseudouridine(38-40) synthase TruA [Gemmatimonadota bacterium]